MRIVYSGLLYIPLSCSSCIAACAAVAMRVEMAADSSAMCVASCVRLYTAYYCGSYQAIIMWLFGSRVPALRARGTHPGWSSLVTHGIGFGRVFGFCAEMPVQRLLELQRVANRGHNAHSRVVAKDWRQVPWRYSQEELHELRLPVLQRLLRSIRHS